MFRHLHIRFFCGLLFAGAPAASAFGQDGQIILGVFIPIIIFVIIVTIIRICWEWRQESYHEPCAEHIAPLSSLETTLKRFLEAPRSVGSVVYDGTATHCKVLLFPNTLVLDHANPNKSNNYIHPLFHTASISPTDPQPSRRRKSNENVVKSDICTLPEKRRSLDYCQKIYGRLNSNLNKEEMKLSQLDLTLSFGQERHCTARRSSSVKSFDMEIWLENRKCIRREDSRSISKRELRVKRRNTIKGHSKRAKVWTKKTKNRQNPRNNRKNSSTICIEEQNKKESNSKIPIRNFRYGLNNTVHCPDNGNKTGRGHHYGRRASLLKTRSKPLKSCLKSGNSRRISSKRVRFTGVLSEPKKNRVGAVRNRNLAALKTSKKSVKKKPLKLPKNVKNNRNISLEPYSKRKSINAQKCLDIYDPTFEICSHSQTRPLNCFAKGKDMHQSSRGNHQFKYRGQEYYHSNTWGNKMHLSEIQLSTGFDPVKEHISDFNMTQNCSRNSFFPPIYGASKNLKQSQIDKPLNLRRQSDKISVFYTEESSLMLPKDDYGFIDYFEFNRQS